MRAHFSLLALPLLVCTLVSAIGQNATISFDGSNSSMLLGTSSSYVQIIADAGELPGVLRAANDLAVDFGKVTGVNGSLELRNSTNMPQNASVLFTVGHLNTFALSAPGNATRGGVIIVGTIGKSALIDGLASSGKISVDGVRGQWEAFTSTVVSQPIAGVYEALVIAGSDKRGAIYGIYDICEQIGVSPWHWFTNIPAQKHEKLYALRSTKLQKSPSVKYRGFFINDEAPALTGWINSKYPKTKFKTPGYEPDFWQHVFEALLRLRANYLWPAMWANMFNADYPLNQPLADAYGVVMGSSHTEPMMRATEEWRYFGNGVDKWQFTTNNATLTQYWKDGALRARPYESLYTMGMRGYGDTALSDDLVTVELQNVVAAQRKILQEVYGDALKVPQMWCLYKEVQGYYEAGMTVPNDVTLLWADDNWGNVRRLPLRSERNRTGGAGVYYHFDYVGDVRDYKWINTIKFEKTWQQMHLAYELGARDIWIVNVGDIKPLEMPISHFFDLAYDINRWGADSTSEWLKLWATREFGSQMADDIAQVAHNYSRLASRKKYELLQTYTYSMHNYLEAEQVIEDWNVLGKKAQEIHDKLSPDLQSAFFQLLLHPVLAGGNQHHVFSASQRNAVYAGQGRNSANMWANHVLEYFNNDAKLTQRYNKIWPHMMDQTHIGYTYWQQPMRQVSPALQYVQLLEGGLNGDLALTVEGTNASVPGDDRYHSLSSNVLTTPPMDPYGPKRWIDIFATGLNPVTFNVQSEPFVKVSQTTGTLATNGSNTDIRLWVQIDWTTAPKGSFMTTINVTSSAPYGTQYGMPQVTIPVNHTTLPPSFTSGFVESDGHVSIEAIHFTRQTQGSSSYTYTNIPGYGRYTSALTIFPVTIPSLTTTSGPSLEYDIYTFTTLPSSTPANLTVILGEGLNHDPTRPLKYAIAIDDQPPQEIKYIQDQTKGNLPVGWGQSVEQAAWISTTKHTLAAAGKHTVRFWALEPGVILTKMVLDLGGVRSSYLGPPESYRIGSG